MSSHQLDEERIFHLAKDIQRKAARSEYLDQICAGDQSLRDRVEALLDVHEREQTFLRSNGAPSSTEDSEIVAAAGEQIGRYKLLQEIGEGGFGVVFMAEQHRPVRRKVALKVIKPGMDTKAVVARFEAERQALAMMDHPNIAKVLDGGATETGRPYFVMELVKGVPLTEYCDQNQLPTEERLELFVTICQAVQHAHHKGIIHRDLKPSNILVTLHDGKPVIKVIDFGVAKATNQQLTEKTLFTAFGQMVGTPQYMSPEQAEISGLDVDTRSDVYSLGVLLYELLAGSTPLEADQLREAGYAEIQRLIKETEPLKPSTRLSTSGDKLTAIAKHRSVSPDRLSALIKGDLDWVVMKALEKDRNRRYSTPSDLGDDVTRYLSKEPVEAFPPSTIYRMRKFIKRNRGLALGAFAFAVFLLMATIVASWGWVRAASTIRDSHELLVERCFLKSIAGEFDEAQKTCALAARAGVPPEWLHTLRGSIAFHEGEWATAIAELKLALDANPDNVSARALLSNAYVFNGQWHEWAQVADDLKGATPGAEYTDFDELFLGYAFFYIDYVDAAKSIESVIRDHPSWLIPRYVWAGAMAHEARRLKDLDNERAQKLIDQALLEVQRSPGLGAIEDPVNSPYVTSMKLYVYDMAFDLMADGREIDDLAATGNRLAEKLSKRPDYAIGGVLREWHYTLVDDDQTAKLDDVRQSIVKFGRGFLLNGPIAEMARVGKFGEILALKDKGEEVEINQALIRIIRNEGEDRNLAMETYEKMKGKYQTWYMRSLLIEIPLLAGELDLATKDARSWIEEMPDSKESGFPSRTRCERARLSYVADSDDYRFTDEPYHVYQREFLEGIRAFGQKNWQTSIELLSRVENQGRVSNRFYWATVLLKQARQHLEGNRQKTRESSQDQSAR